MPKVCVYAIAKNEAQFVDRFMDSMAEADIICVLDTGSTDDTVEKLRRRHRLQLFHGSVSFPFSSSLALRHRACLVPSSR